MTDTDSTTPPLPPLTRPFQYDNQWHRCDLDAVLGKERDIYAPEDLLSFLCSLLFPGAHTKESETRAHYDAAKEQCHVELWHKNAKYALFLLRDTQLLLQLDLAKRRIGLGEEDMYWPLIVDEDYMEMQVICTFLLSAIQSFVQKQKRQ